MEEFKNHKLANPIWSTSEYQLIQIARNQKLRKGGEIVRGACSVCDTLCTVCCLFEITEEDHVDVTEGVRGRTGRSAWRRSPVLVEGAEYALQRPDGER